MQIEELEKILKEENSLASYYLLYGEEEFLLESTVKKIRKAFGEKVKGINDILIDETNLPQIIPNIQMPAFGYERKLITIKNSGFFKKEAKKKQNVDKQQSVKLLEFLKKNKSLVENNIVLLFIEQEAEKNELFSFIEEKGIICEFNFQKPMQLQKRLKSICNAYKVEISDSNLKYFIERLWK